MSLPYDHHSIDAKWQAYWADNEVARVDTSGDGPKYYMLMMFPYPSGDLHVGHGRNYILGDALYRSLRMAGKQPLNPMGWDAFGLPAENAAIAGGAHPRESTVAKIERMKEQFRRWGVVYDWSKELASCQPEYYRWNQALFLRMYEKGLAYKKQAPVNWCPKDQTVLANEQVVDGGCDRCGTEVVQKELSQWFFRITDYAQDLLDGLDELDEWPDRVRTMQRNWIGRSTGADLTFEVIDDHEPLQVFTTRPDTLYGATFMCMAPDHPRVERLLESSSLDEAARADVRAFIEQVQNTSRRDRESEGGLKEGRFLGRYAINPCNGERLPIWLANYVLPEYGTGAIMAVPAHDQRDFEFARQYELPIKRVYLASGEDADAAMEAATIPQGGNSKVIGSDDFDGLAAGPETIDRFITAFADRGFGEAKVRFRLRDWLVSRQRYWGTPIPIIYCDDCGAVPAKEADLPVLLPMDVELRGLDGNALELSESFLNVDCPSCNRPARRETDTMDTFVDSSWYFFRFIDPQFDAGMFDREKVARWLPVDQYIGGIEHAILHLLYARFICRVLKDLGDVDISEPFTRLFNQGMITKEGFRDPTGDWVPVAEVERDEEGRAIRRRDGALLTSEMNKMSKSKGNVVAPDELIDKFGADTERVYTLFISPPEKEAEWSDDGILGASRFLGRVWQQADKVRSLSPELADVGEPERDLLRKCHQTIARIDKDLSRFQFNTWVAALMELSNSLGDYLNIGTNGPVAAEVLDVFIRLLHPIAPHVSEELHELSGGAGTILHREWPEVDPSWLAVDEVEVVVQVMGKVRSRLMVPVEFGEDEIRDRALADPAVTRWIEGKTIRKAIYVARPGRNRLLNLVVG